MLDGQLERRCDLSGLEFEVEPCPACVGAGNCACAEQRCERADDGKGNHAGRPVAAVAVAQALEAPGCVGCLIGNGLLVEHWVGTAPATWPVRADIGRRWRALCRLCAFLDGWIAFGANRPHFWGSSANRPRNRPWTGVECPPRDPSATNGGTTPRHCGAAGAGTSGGSAQSPSRAAKQRSGGELNGRRGAAAPRRSARPWARP